MLLVLIIAFLGVRLYNVLTTHFEIPMEAAASSSRKIEYTTGKENGRTGSVPHDVIAAGNLFHPSRSMKKKPAVTSRPVADSELPQLFGTVIMNEKKFAILEDRSTKKSSLYKVNDAVSGFIIARILENKVILQKDGESIEVNLRADKKFTPPKRTQARQRTIRKTPAQRKRRTARPRRRQPPVRNNSGR